MLKKRCVLRCTGDECRPKSHPNVTDLEAAYSDDGPPVPKGNAGNGNDCPTGTQFPVPFPYGYGQHMWYNDPNGPSRDMWAIVDQVTHSMISNLLF